MSIYTNKFKETLKENGIKLLKEFCELNNIKEPEIRLSNINGNGYCGFYKYLSNRINIDVDACARVNVMYSFPGFTSDRTPQGVIIHEFSHYVDEIKGDISEEIYKNSKEKPITGYKGSSADEWFAEMMRLFVSNPDLLKNIRPKTYNELSKHFIPLNRGGYAEVLAEFVVEIPERIKLRLNKLLK